MSPKNDDQIAETNEKGLKRWSKNVPGMQANEFGIIRCLFFHSVLLEKFVFFPKI